MLKDKVYSNNPHTEDDLKKKKHCDWLWMCLLHHKRLQAKRNHF